MLSRTETTNGVASTWGYQYQISQRSATLCPSGCTQGFIWGDINDNDYADYYNFPFISFAKTQVTQPDSSYQIYTYYATPGDAVLDISVAHCVDNDSSVGFTCSIFLA